MSENDILTLRQKLGLPEKAPLVEINRPPNNMQVQIDADQISLYSDSEDYILSEFGPGPACKPVADKISDNIEGALFGDDTPEVDEWDLPKINPIEKGKPIAQSLATLINTACTTKCETEPITKKYKVPENCDKLCPPLINNEIFKILDKRARSYDRAFMEIQNLTSFSMVPVIKLAETLKPHIMANPEAKTMLSEIITLIGQIQYNLSLRRRYQI